MGTSGGGPRASSADSPDPLKQMQMQQQQQVQQQQQQQQTQQQVNIFETLNLLHIWLFLVILATFGRFLTIFWRLLSNATTSTATAINTTTSKYSSKNFVAAICLLNGILQ